MQYAWQWSQVSLPDFSDTGKRKIRFTFIPYQGSTSGNVADVRILFKPGGSSSYIGSDARRIPQNEPTMYFGWINEDEPEENISQVVLHEFGHAVGLGHEHQHPGSNIPWDKVKVYEYYHSTQDPPWEREKVDANIFQKYSSTETNYSNYDTNSIMHYAIPDYLTIGDYSTPWNSQLSKLDKAFIKQVYPYHPCIVNETCCFDRHGKKTFCP